MTAKPAEVASQLDTTLSDVASALFTLDGATDMVFVRTQADAGNSAAAALVTSLGLAWERYPLAKDAVERLQAAVASRDHAAADALLGPAAVTLPDGSTIGVAALLEDIRLRVEHLAPEVATMAAGAREAVARLDAARATFQDLLVRAGAVGADDDVEITAARAAVDQAMAAVAADPTAAHAGLGDLDRVLAAARDRVETLERGHRRLPGALATAAAQLVALESLAAQGREAAIRTRDRILDPAGMLAPVDLAAGGDGALGPWLERIRRQAESGATEAADAALTAWQREADATLAEATRVAEANAAPLLRRNELRGLLDAYRAKAAATGRDEDGRLDRAHAAAKDALYVAPCDLATAERLVSEYMAAVNATLQGGAR